MPASCPIFSPPITTPAIHLKAGTRRRHNACMTDLLAHHTRSGGQWRVVNRVRNAVPAPVNHGQPWAVEPIQTTNIGVLVSRPRSSPPSRADGGGNRATDKQRSTNKDPSVQNLSFESNQRTSDSRHQHHLVSKPRRHGLSIWSKAFPDNNGYFLLILHSGRILASRNGARRRHATKRSG
jgi:hypothetical protein